MNNLVTSEQIDKIIAEGTIEVEKKGEKTTTVLFTTKEGFEFFETAACVSPENYNMKIGKEICLKRIKDKLWAFEGYCLQKELYNTRPTTAKERVEIERQELIDRLEKLSVFLDKCDDMIEKGENPPISSLQRGLLRSQLETMEIYKNTLTLRLRNWEE